MPWAIGHLGLFAAVLALFAVMPSMMRHDPQLRDPQNLPVRSLLIDVVAIMTVALFAPLLIPPLVRLLTLPVPSAPGAVGLLPRQNPRQNALSAVRRTVSTATPLFLVIGLTGTVVGSTLAFGDARSQQSRASLNASYVVEPTAGSTPVGRHPAGSARAARRPYHHGPLHTPDRSRRRQLALGVRHFGHHRRDGHRRERGHHLEAAGRRRLARSPFGGHGPPSPARRPCPTAGTSGTG